MAILQPRPLQLRRKRRSLIDVELDSVQRAAVERPPGGAMLVLGEAGHGKTTVALHRLAHLYRNAPLGFRASVVVPHQGLEQLLQPLVTQLGLDVRVRTYDRWARAQARRVFGDLPRRESVSAPASVIRMKRSRALHPLLQQLAAAPPRPIDDDFDAPPPETNAHAHRADLQHLFGDGDRMRELARALGQGPRAVEQMLEHTFVQFSLRSEHAYSHVDADRLITLDRGTLDAGTPLENAGAIDPEDYAVLFELDRLRARRLGLPPSRVRRFDCIAIDEAQELAPLELRLIARGLRPGGSLIVAGDADQQTDAAADFTDWSTTMRRLRATEHETVKLEIGYRCPPPVVQLARRLRSAHAPATESSTSSHAYAPDVLRFDNLPQLLELIVREAKRLERHDSGASACVITRTPELARFLSNALRGRVLHKLALGSLPSSARGLMLTTIEHIKGLEFDFVILPDVSAAVYPPTAESSRGLYVAVTRACHQLVLACVGEPSVLVRNTIDGTAASIYLAVHGGER